MSYNYQTERPRIFTEEGQEMFLKIRDRTAKIIAESGAAMAQNMWSGVTGDTWMMSACIDRMVELGEIKEVTDREKTWGQHRVFVNAKVLV